MHLRIFMRQFHGLQLKDWLSLCNAACGVGAIFAAAQSYAIAAILVCVAAVFDYFDGKVARGGAEGENEFGKHLDSLCDSVSFVVAPTIMLLYVPVIGWIALATAAAALLYAFAGVVRLARYNLQDEKRIYAGLPVPIAAVLLVVAMPFAKEFAFVPAIALGVLMASHLRIRKL
ncbi:hypothetical protein COT29_00810 [Candidatus Micrarchaeota archaeon CG08_land_8_20_14_0_20_59_11]|nr:MAG: hypothetical protein COT29_00810 [Candidatus Micrarchaeota archaeon CG08_land_8_20_14_0_20_59_11]